MISGALAVPLILTGLFLPSITFAIEGDDSPDDTAPAELAPSLAERVAEAAAAGAMTPTELATEATLPVEGGGSLVFDDAARITATVLFDGVPTGGTLAAVEEIAEVTALLERYSATTVRVAPERLIELTEIDGVRDATPALAPDKGSARAASSAQATQSLWAALPGVLPAAPAGEVCGSVPAEADGPLKSGEAKAEHEVDGSGVTIGIISDTFDFTDVPTSWEDDVASGALPGPGNPCGYEQPVAILEGMHKSSEEGASDEGRAMAQLVHSIAPGAEIIHADSGKSVYEMAENLDGLVKAGADIIVDDIDFHAETYFQKDALSVAIDAARAQGVGYFSAIGNDTVTALQGASIGEPLNSWQTRNYRPMACPDWVQFDFGPIYDCLDFHPDEHVEQAYDVLTIGGTDPAQSFTLELVGSIAEPINDVTTRYVVQAYVDNGGADPSLLSMVGSLGGTLPGIFGELDDLPHASKIRLVVLRSSIDPEKPQQPALQLGFRSGADHIVERQFMGDEIHDWVGESGIGHTVNGSAISVAALEWDVPTSVRWYSSLGPGTLLFEPDVPGDPTWVAAPLPEPLMIDSPQIAGVDGLATTFFREDDRDVDGAYRFYGTSAAAPTVAAVAALGLSYSRMNSGLTLDGETVSKLVIETARGTEEEGPINPYDDNRFRDEHVFGSGIADAMKLFERIDEGAAAPDPVPAQPAPTPESGVSGTGGSLADRSGAHANSALAHQSGALPRTGADDATPLIIGAVVLVLLGAAVVTIAALRK